jgi:hypothetical protein
MSLELIDFVVGGIQYPIHKSDIEKYPGSFLSAAVKRDWHDGQTPIFVDRDGQLFRHVYAYVVSGCLSKAAKSSKNIALLNSIRQEAEYFGLPELAEECAQYGVITPLHNYNTIRSFNENAKQGTLCVEHPTTRSFSSPLLVALGSVWAPFCVVDSIRSQPSHHPSVLSEIDVADLIANASPSSYRRRSETRLKSSLSGQLEIPVDKLGLKDLWSIVEGFNWSIRYMYPHPTTVKPYKLVIYQQGEFCEQHRDTVRGDGHIGTVVVILNSKYTGGELEVTHGGRTEVVAGPYNWVAMYGDCLYKINPIISGTLVLLIYDIYTTRPAQPGHAADSEIDSADDDDDDDLENEFWYFRGDPIDETKARGANVPAVHKALSRELRKWSSVVICLQHMYPACPVVPGLLKGADSLLYQLFCETLQDHYEVQIVYCSIYLEDADGDGQFVDARGNLFTHFEDDAVWSVDDARLVVTALPDSDRIVDHVPYQKLGNGSTVAEETVYVVTGLQVRRRRPEEGLGDGTSFGATRETPGSSLKRKAGDSIGEGATQDAADV